MLNAGYEPLNIVNWQKAMILWLQNKVDILQYHDDIKVSTATDKFLLPSVMKLRKYVRPYQAYNVRLSRTNVFLRDRHICQYCHDKFALKLLTIDHVMPASRGGASSWLNLTTACQPCNYQKGNRTPEEAGLTLLNQPFKPEWLPSQKDKYNLESLPKAWREFLRRA